MSDKSHKWVPEIVYGENGSEIPFVQVPEDKVMPGVLFIFESKETGEFEPDMEGNEIPIVDFNLHSYANMSILKANLTKEEYDKVRQVLSLSPLDEATSLGKAITENIKENIE